MKRPLPLLLTCLTAALTLSPCPTHATEIPTTGIPTRATNILPTGIPTRATNTPATGIPSHTTDIPTSVQALAPAASLPTPFPGKQLYIPEELRENDFESNTAQWSYSRMRLTPNFAIFWERGFGSDLQNPPALDGHPMSVDLQNLERQLERFYAFYRDTLHFIGTSSNAAKYRMLVMLNYSLDGTAYGGDYDEVIGAFWVAPNRIQDRTLNCVAHELGHSFQMQVHCDRRAEAVARGDSLDRWFGGGFFEMTSQWMLWHVNPYWVRDELYHWEAYRRTPHKAFLHWENVYHAPYVLEWWSQQHGLDIIGDIYKQGQPGEGATDTYRRLTHQSRTAFYDELFEAHRHTLFLDFRHARTATRPYIGGFRTLLTDEQTGWHRFSPVPGGAWLHPDSTVVPEDGGFNAIPLAPPAPGQSVSIDFDGQSVSIDFDGQIAAAPSPGISAAASHPAWRYGFVALLSDGSCLYSPVYNKVRGRARFTSPTRLRVLQLYLVVMPDAPGTYRLRQS